MDRPDSSICGHRAIKDEVQDPSLWSWPADLQNDGDVLAMNGAGARVCTSASFLFKVQSLRVRVGKVDGELDRVSNSR